MNTKALETVLRDLPDELREEVYRYASYLRDTRMGNRGDDRQSSALRTPNLHPGATLLHDDFDAPLPDVFWLGG